MNEDKLTRSWWAPRPCSLIGLMKTIKLAVDDTRDSQTTSGLGRKGPEPRSVLGAPLILANKDMQRGATIPGTLLAGQRRDAWGALLQKGGPVPDFRRPLLEQQGGRKLPHKKSSALLMAPQMNHGKSGVATSRYRISIGSGRSPDSCQQPLAKRSSCDPDCQASRQSPGNTGLNL